MDGKVDSLAVIGDGVTLWASVERRSSIQSCRQAKLQISTLLMRCGQSRDGIMSFLYHLSFFQSLDSALFVLQLLGRPK